jgi:hypothetical protein
MNRRRIFVPLLLFLLLLVAVTTNPLIKVPLFVDGAPDALLQLLTNKDDTLLPPLVEDSGGPPRAPPADEAVPPMSLLHGG